ncbi:hypothetical protein [Candidatus Pantoea multigeneris]|uniref:hypothetical protein n=1 Tax=Candidatus Pantoea multigeneris TaxID=2608357 RepID=UPI00141E72B0|nr:hypothetical protein [Pantoea multigeneris]
MLTRLSIAAKAVFLRPHQMKNHLRAHYARHQPYYEITAIAAIWIALLIAALVAEIYLE